MTSGQKWFAIAGVILIALVIIGAVSNSLEPEPKAMAETTTTYAVPVTTTTQAPTTTTQAPTTTTTTVPPTGKTLRDDIDIELVDAAFVMVMRDASYELDQLTWVDIVDDDYIIEWGNLFCFQMDEHGGVWEDAVVYAIDAGVRSFGVDWNNDDTMMIAIGSGAALAAYCPWYSIPAENPWG